MGLERLVVYTLNELCGRNSPHTRGTSTTRWVSRGAAGCSTPGGRRAGNSRTAAGRRRLGRCGTTGRGSRPPRAPAGPVAPRLSAGEENTCTWVSTCSFAQECEHICSSPRVHSCVVFYFFYFIIIIFF